MDWIESAIPFLASVAVLLGFRYFRKRYPPPECAKADTQETLSRKSYILRSASGIVLILAIGGVIFVGTVHFLHFCNHLISDRHGSSIYLLTPSWSWWQLYAGFLAVSLCYFPSIRMLRRIMGGRTFRMWMQKGYRQAGFDGSRALRMLALTIMIPYTMLLVPSLGCHTSFSETEIGIQGYGEITEARYTYSQVNHFALVRGDRLRSGGLQHDPHLVIDFDDGQRWTSRQGLRDSEMPDMSLISFLESKAGKRTLHAASEEALTW